MVKIPKKHTIPRQNETKIIKIQIILAALTIPRITPSIKRYDNITKTLNQLKLVMQIIIKNKHSNNPGSKAAKR